MLFVFIINIFGHAANLRHCRCCRLLTGNLRKHAFFKSHGTRSTGNAQT